MNSTYRRLSCLALLAGLTVVALFDSAPLAVSASTTPTPEYSRWVEPYHGKAIAGYFGNNKSVPLKLIVTAIEHDEPNTDKSEFIERKISYGSQISIDGRIGSFYISSMGHKGGGFPKLAAADFAHFNQLLKKVPDDGGVLPPPNRRLVFQISDGKQFRVRVYDRADAPEAVWEILRLFSGIRSFVPQFAPTAKWTAHGNKDGALAVSHDGKQIISAAWYEPLKFWNPQTQHSIKQLDAGKEFGVQRIVISPNGSLIALEEGSDVHLVEIATGKILRKFIGPTVGPVTYSLTHPQFTRDGKFLLLQIGDQLLRIYEVATGKRLDSLPELPANAVAFSPSPDGRFALYETKQKTVLLWDKAKKSDLMRLDEKARINQVAFSPDGSLIAVATSHPGPGGYWSIQKLRVWNIQTGALLHELKPFEQSTCEAIEGVLWSRDGNYVLAATKSNSFFTSRGISVWNVASGRHRGEFTGPITDVNGLALLNDGKLVAGCNDGVIRIWDFPAALQKITEFERSLPSFSANSLK